LARAPPLQGGGRGFETLNAHDITAGQRLFPSLPGASLRLSAITLAINLPGMPIMGSLRQRSEGVWQARVHAGLDPSSGKRRYAARTIHARNEKEAARELRKLEKSVAAGRHPKGTTAVTLGDQLHDSSLNAHRVTPVDPSRATPHAVRQLWRARNSLTGRNPRRHLAGSARADPAWEGAVRWGPAGR
jgi:hypothetical protein